MCILWYSLCVVGLLLENGAEESQEASLEGSLVKDKFGNTMNLIEADDTELHRHISDSDIR